jgi:ketol-acid reductoisomerase
MTVPEASAWGDVVMILIPDQNRKRSTTPTSSSTDHGKMLMFGHGLSIRFGFIVPPKDST